MKINKAYNILGYNGKHVRGHAARAVRSQGGEWIIAATDYGMAPDKSVCRTRPSRKCFNEIEGGEAVRVVAMDGPHPSDDCEPLVAWYEVVQKSSSGLIVLSRLDFRVTQG